MKKTSTRSDISGVLNAPASKSYAQRALAAGLLSQGETTLRGMELCADTTAALSVVEALGAKVEQLDQTSYVIAGGMTAMGLNPVQSIINVGESGLSTRMFTPIAALCNTPITIIGKGSMLERPIDMMERPLRSLGVKIGSNLGLLPIAVQGPMTGGKVEIDGSLSSQFITGLLMALPLAHGDTTMRVTNPTSIPYIDMTLDLLQDSDIEISHTDYREFYVKGWQRYRAHEYNVEGDWSGASCLLVAGAIGGEITVKGLNPMSIQADVMIIRALTLAGAEVITTPNDVTVRRRELEAFEFDATQCPDLFPALVALAACCRGETFIKGTKRLVHKESDRAEALREEFGKMGIEVDISQSDVMRVVGGEIKSAEVSSHNDHRIAMAAAVAALRCDDRVTIHGAEAVDKSYPNFWRDIDSVRREEGK